MEFPKSQGINTKLLQRLFDNMSECYKLFWFQAIIDKVVDGKTILTFNELINDMIANAWYMVMEYKLNLGPADSLEFAVQAAQRATGLKSSEKKEKIIAALQTSNDKVLRQKKYTLTHKVPFRLQAPFLPDIKGDTWYCSKKELADKIKTHEGIIYWFNAIEGLNSVIEVNPNWVQYICRNYEILSGWVQYNLIQYLQRRNPNVPGIPNKLKPPQERNLDKVKKFWRAIITIAPVHEIYGSSELAPAEISIDHFVPWSYVAHDELWNLNPTTKSINSKKSNHLPAWETYYPKLRALEYHAYDLIWKYSSVYQEFEKCLKEHVNSTDVQHKLYRLNLSKDEFYQNLEGIIRPVYLAAQNMGFENWRL